MQQDEHHAQGHAPLIVGRRVVGFRGEGFRRVNFKLQVRDHYRLGLVGDVDDAPGTDLRAAAELVDLQPAADLLARSRARAALPPAMP